MSRAQAFFLLCFAASCYMVYLAVTGFIDSHRVSEDEAVAAAEVAAATESKAHLEAVVDYVSSDLYVEQEARRRLGFVREGEVPIVVVSPPAPEPPAANGEWWERLFPR